MQTASAATRPARNAKRALRPVLLVQIGLLAMMAACGMAVAALSLGFDDLVFPSCSVVCLTSIWSFYSWQLLGRDWFSPYGLFLFSASLFNGGQAFLEVLRLNPDGVMDGTFSPELTVKALYMVALGLTALHLGALLAVSSTAGTPANPPMVSDDKRNRVCRTVGWLCLIVAAIPTALVLRDVLVVVASQGYRGLYGRSVDDILPTSIRTLAGGIVPAVMFLGAAGQRRRTLLIALWCIVLAYSGIWILAGLRHVGAPLLMAFAWLYHLRIRRLPRTALLATGIALLSLFALVAAVRNSQTPFLDSLQQARATNPTLRNPVVAAVAEMGMSLNTVAHTISFIPAIRPYDYGVGYFYAMLRVVPNLGWEVHPAAAHGAYSDWLTRTLEPTTAAHGGGFGFSFIAEPFANFGWFGVMPVLALVGYLLVRMTDWAVIANDPARCAVTATFLVSLLFFPRDESAGLFRPLVYYALLPYAAIALSYRKSSTQKLTSKTLQAQRLDAYRNLWARLLPAARKASARYSLKQQPPRPGLSPVPIRYGAAHRPLPKS